MKLRTWHKEALVVASVLIAVAVYRNSRVEWLGGLAVFFTFMHASVSFRLSEAEERRTVAQVECFRKAQYYFLLKETCWFTYFLLIGAWSALVGVVVFLVYPLWRKYHVSQCNLRMKSNERN